MSSTHFHLSSTVAHHPVYPYEMMKDAILGRTYELSLCFVGTTRARRLNQAHRHKTYVPNVLSFPLSERCGEIFLCPAVANKEASHFNLSRDGYIAYLFIHGCLHLKGYDHGDTMEALERRYLKRFAIV